MNTLAAPCATHVLYLHGFRSSSQSTKARMVGERVAQRHSSVRWWCPALAASPAQAMADVLQGLSDWPAERTVVCGSSLGGFYARWLQLHWSARAVLLNPAVHPARDLARHIGELPQWHDPSQKVFFEARHVEELRQMEADIARLAPRQAVQSDTLFAIVAQDDEVLDWREMRDFCAGADLRLLSASDHAISDFAEHIDAMFDFMRLCTPDA